ncbi:MAG: hypothetical protein IJA67_07715, partial [Oscillospiraceae bacterium]|nr:hypothetical protein [Oscillospiraceae bacterium]
GGSLRTIDSGCIFSAAFDIQKINDKFLQVKDGDKIQKNQCKIKKQFKTRSFGCVSFLYVRDNIYIFYLLFPGSENIDNLPRGRYSMNRVVRLERAQLNGVILPGQDLGSYRKDDFIWQT